MLGDQALILRGYDRYRTTTGFYGAAGVAV